MLRVEQLAPLSRLRVLFIKKLEELEGEDLITDEPFPEIRDGPSQVPVMQVLSRNHPQLEYVEIGRTVWWCRSRGGWTWNDSKTSAVVDLA